MIEVNYNDYKRILEENMRLIPENHKLKKEAERLSNIINELALLFDDYMSFVEVLEKYNYELKGSGSNE